MLGIADGEETTPPRPVALARSFGAPSTLIRHRVVGGLRHDSLPVRLALRGPPVRCVMRATTRLMPLCARRLVQHAYFWTGRV